MLHQSSPNRLDSLQVLRGLAALFVVIGHLVSIEARNSADPILSPSFVIGFFGVDLFFVLSGFVMVHTTRHFVAAHDWQARSRAGIEFALARAIRIYPAYWLAAFALMAYLLLSIGLPYDPSQLLGQSPVPFLAQSLLLWPQLPLPVLAVGWTLVHEVHFYMMFGLLVWLLPRVFLPIGLAVWAALSALGALLGLSDPTAENWISLATHPLTQEFILGAFIGLGFGWWTEKASALHRHAKSLGFGAIAVGSIWLIAGSVVLDVQATPDFPMFWGRVLAFGPAFGLILAGAVLLEHAGAFKPMAQSRAWKGLVSLGDWSYALYLTHILSMSALAAFIWQPIGMPGFIDNVIALPVLIAFSILVAALMFNLFERPLAAFGQALRAGLRQKFAQNTPTHSPIDHENNRD